MGGILELKIMSLASQAVKEEVNRNCSSRVHGLVRHAIWQLGTGTQEIDDILDNQEIWLLEDMS